MIQRKTLNLLVLLTLVMTFSLTITGCDPECVAGTACECEGGSCDFECESEDEGGCDFNCSDGAACTASCPGGGCAMECSGADSCALDCPGDTCTLNCTDTGSCTISSCGTACVLNCGGAGTCSNSCDMMSACTTTD